MIYKAFLIKNLTNMHVGSGDNNFGVVDNLVQRDPVTEHPTIHSSSLKGALREYCKEDNFVEKIFGSENSSGCNRFFQANLLAVPVRSNKKPYFMATCSSVIREFINNFENFDINSDKLDEFKKLTDINPSPENVFIHHKEPVRIEDYNAEYNENIPKRCPYIGSNIALFSDNDFKQITKFLPVIARNCLENGQSTNLWYEEIVPRKSVFYFIVGIDKTEDKHFTEAFEKKITSGTVQIGGNATIGYGFVKISKIGG